MEKAQAGTARNSESSTLVKKTDVDELSKEKEEELLFGAEDEDGEDEDTMSDDSLRLRLSDDDAEEEQEQAVTNDTNIVKLKPQSKRTEQPVLDTAVEEKLHSGLREPVKKISKSEESTQKESIATIKVPENSTLPLDECTSENKQIQDNTCKEKNSATNKSNEKRTIKSSIDLKSTDISNACSSIESNNKLEKDNLSISNRIHTSTVQNATDKKLIIHEEKNLKKIASEREKIISTTCEPNKLDNNSPSIDCANIKSKQLSTAASVSNNDNLREKMIEKHIENNSLKHLHVELINGPDNVDLCVQSGNSKDSSSHKDVIVHKSKNKNPVSVNVTESETASHISKFTENTTSISLVQNQNISSNVKDNTEVTNKDCDINKSVIQTVAINNLKSQNILIIPSDVDNSNNDKGAKSTDTIGPRKKRIRKTINTVQEYAEEDKQEGKERGRQRRKTAKNAEEIIRKKYLNSDSDSSDNSEKFVIVNHKVNVDAHPASPPSLKRNCPENVVFNGNTKKAKMSIKNSEEKNVAQLSFVEKFFRRDFKEKLPRLTQEELEELLIQKIVETIAMRSEIGQLREQARISERYQETTRVKMQQLLKQVKDFEMVLNRNTADRRANPDKSVAPIKINRSVGLQVSFITEHGIQNLRQATVKSTANTTTTANSTASSTTTTETNSNATGSRRTGIKIRSPRSAVAVTTPVITQNHSLPTAPVISTVTPAALVVAKPLEVSSHTLTLSKQSTNIQPILPAVSQQSIPSQSHQTIVLNGKVQNQVNRPQFIAPKPRSNDLIDLTDEGDKNKSANAKVTSTTTTSILEQQLNVPKCTQSFQRVIQAIPANVVPTIAQPASIKVLTTNQQSTPTLVNNVNQPRVAFVMPSATGSPRQVLIANSNQQVQIRPMSGPRAQQQFSTVTYKRGVASALANGAVHVLATPVLSNVQINTHPAPLPDIPNYAATPGWKLPPPEPSLKISKVSNGIVLSWNMTLTEKYAEIASYQLYAYQEVAGVNPSTSLWKKVGDVRALPLPMACTLTQFSEGNNYYFAVRAVDTHSRKGKYSKPGNISL